MNIVLLLKNVFSFLDALITYVRDRKLMQAGKREMEWENEVENKEDRITMVTVRRRLDTDPGFRDRVLTALGRKLL